MSIMIALGILSHLTHFLSLRALRILPTNMDPLPKEITTIFGLPSLHDVSLVPLFRHAL